MEALCIIHKINVFTPEKFLILLFKSPHSIVSIKQKVQIIVKGSNGHYFLKQHHFSDIQRVPS